MVSRNQSDARDELLAMLEDDHRRVERSFEEFEAIDPEEAGHECEALVRQTCAELEAHGQLEEELLYPAAREAIENPRLIDEAQVEHDTARLLIEQLRELGPDDDRFAATFKVLGEYVRHHVTEEEDEIFHQLRRAELDWNSLLRAALARREDLIADLGLDGR